MGACAFNDNALFPMWDVRSVLQYRMRNGYRMSTALQTTSYYHQTEIPNKKVSCAHSLSTEWVGTSRSIFQTLCETILVVSPHNHRSIDYKYIWANGTMAKNTTRVIRWTRFLDIPKRKLGSIPPKYQNWWLNFNSLFYDSIFYCNIWNTSLHWIPRYSQCTTGRG